MLRSSRTRTWNISQAATAQLDEQIKQLELALDRRSFLVHRYFFERVYGHDVDGRQEPMIAELEAIRALFDATNKAINEVFFRYLGKHGITQEVIEAEALKLKAGAAVREQIRIAEQRPAQTCHNDICRRAVAERLGSGRCDFGFPAAASAGAWPDGRAEPETPAIKNLPAVLADPHYLLGTPTRCQGERGDRIEVEAMAAADELLHRTNDVCLVLGLGELIVVVDESLRLLKREPHDRIGDEVFRTLAE